MADVTLVTRDGALLTPWMLYRINQLDADFKRTFGYNILVSSGVRTAAMQEAIFRARYVLAGDVRGRKVYDTRWWNGRLWYRISPAGTVAAPNSPQANHQIQGTKGAVDLRDTGPDAGIMTASSKRGRWIRKNARKYDLVAEGDSFGEGWHFAMLGVLRTPPKPPAPKPTNRKRKDMILLSGPDSQSGTTNILVVAGPGIWDRYADTKVQRAALVSQFGNPVVLGKIHMVDREKKYLAAGPTADAIATAIAGALE